MRAKRILVELEQERLLSDWLSSMEARILVAVTSWPVQSQVPILLSNRTPCAGSKTQVCDFSAGFRESPPCAKTLTFQRRWGQVWAASVASVRWMAGGGTTVGDPRGVSRWGDGLAGQNRVAGFLQRGGAIGEFARRCVERRGARCW